MYEESLFSAVTAALPSSRQRNGFRIGGVSVQMSGDVPADVTLGSLLEPFQFLPSNPDIDIRVNWFDRLPAIAGDQIFDSGSVWKLSVDENGYRFDFSVPFLGPHPYRRLLVDFDFTHAALEMSRECFASSSYQPDPWEYPLDELLIMHRLTQEKAIELHGTGIVRPNGEANLFVGHSGAGKSTTTRLWTSLEDVEVLSDDRIIVRRDEEPSAVRTPRQADAPAGTHGVLRLREKYASRASRSAQDDNRDGDRTSQKYPMRMYGTPWHGEAMYASPNSAPLARIFVLEHGHGNVITPLSSGQAVAELFARSFVPFHRHEYVESALAFLEEVADSVPVYRYSFEPDERAVEKIMRFHD